MRNVTMLALLAPLCGCGHSQPPASGGDAPFVSGSRLRAKWYDVDGASAFAGWFDKQLGTDCAFNVAEDGEWRCMPASYAIAESHFADSSCKRPLVTLFCRAGNYVSTFPEYGTCSSAKPRAWKVVSPWSDKTWSLVGNTCTADGVQYGQQYWVEPVAATALAHATTRQVSLDDRLAVTLMDGDDGSRQGLWQYSGETTDLQRSMPCDVLEKDFYAIDQSVCAPSAAYDSGRYYSDPACTKAVDYSCSRDALAVSPDDDTGCHQTLRQVGSRVTAATVYSNSGGSCVGEPAVGQFANLWTPGAPVALDGLPILDDVPVGAGTARRVELQTAAGKTLAHTGSFIDPANGPPCHAESIGAAGLRCVPDSYIALSNDFRNFADSRCTHEIALDFGCPKAPVPTLALREAAAGACGWATAYRVGAQLPGNAYYSSSGGAMDCQMQALDGARLRELAPLDPSTLPAITERTE